MKKTIANTNGGKRTPTAENWPENDQIMNGYKEVWLEQK